MSQSPADQFKQFYTQSLKRIIDILQDDPNSLSTIDHVIRLLEELIVYSLQGLQLSYVNDDCINKLLEVKQLLDNYYEENTLKHQHQDLTGLTGRPRCNIPLETLKLYLENDFTIKEISSFLHCSESTIKRRISESNLRETVPKFSDISNEDLDSLVIKFLQDFPNSGIRMTKGYLRSQGIKVTFEQVRQTLWRVDPAGILNRAIYLNIIQRREYMVPGSLALWHIDGNHKLGK